MKSSILRDKSFAFAVLIVRIVQSLQKEKEYVLSKQLLRSGTAIGALLREGEFASSTADFINKLTVAVKEANETEYWLLLLNATDYIKLQQYNELSSNCQELIAMLVASIKTLKSKNTGKGPK